MSDPILPLRQWPSGIQQASVPANDNALRLESLSRPCLGVANDASGTDADGDVWLVGDTPTGAFAEFTENDIALYRDGIWYAWAPVDGLRLVVNDVRKVYVGESTDEWQDDPSGGIPDAPSDGTGYVRKDGAWAAESGGGGGTDRSTVTALSISSGVVNIDCSLGDFFTLSLTANVTSITFSNLPAAGKGASIAVQIRQDGTGSRTVSLPSSFKATGGSDTSVQSAANAYTLLTLTTFDQGTRWAYAMQEVAP